MTFDYFDSFDSVKLHIHCDAMHAWRTMTSESNVGSMQRAVRVLKAQARGYTVIGNVPTITDATVADYTASVKLPKTDISKIVPVETILNMPWVAMDVETCYIVIV